MLLWGIAYRSHGVSLPRKAAHSPCAGFLFLPILTGRGMAVLGKAQQLDGMKEERAAKK